MSLRARLVAYLVALHALLAGLAWHALRERPLWLFGAEAALLLSVGLGASLGGRLLGALRLAGESARLLDEGELTTRFRPVGQPEVDRLIGVYNRMVDALREERTRLQEQHFFLERIVTASPSGILTLDADGRIDSVNPAAERLLRRDGATLRGASAAEVVPAPLAELAPGTSQVVSWDGRRFKCHRGTFMDRGIPRGFLLVDELTEELRRAERAAYEKLIRLMAHEVNNTLGASNSLLHSCLAYAAQLPDDDRRDMTRALEVVIGRTDQLGAFMRSFADVVRLPPPRLVPTDLSALVDRVTTLMRPAAEARGIGWRTEHATPLPTVPLDPAQMEQVLVNVVKNAIEAVSGGGEIVVRTGLRGGRPCVSVVDTGPGLVPEARAHLFTPFFSTKEGGQGLGLTLVREIVTNHGFTCQLEGPPGGPTEFVVAM